jgi:hypothetical protein
MSRRSAHFIDPMGLLVALLLLHVSGSPAAEERLSFDAVATGVMQSGDFDQAVNTDDTAIGDTTRGSLAIDIEGTAIIGSSGKAFALASYAEGNGLDGVGGVSVRVNADDMEDDVKDINGTGRDYLLEAWYAHRFELDPSLELELTGGIIDATRYIDSNRVANDEIHQFMNEVFVNRFFLPSYDPGVAVSVTGHKWSAHGVWMKARVDETDGRTRTFDFYGLDLGSSYKLAIGEGDFRIVGLTTSHSFGGTDSAIHGLGFSMSQSLGQRVILFARGGGFSDEESVLIHDSLYSAGLQISSGPSSPSGWVGGLAYGFLGGAGDASGDVRETRVWESYVRWLPTETFDISMDLQYVADERYAESNPTLWCAGLRANYSF